MLEKFGNNAKRKAQISQIIENEVGTLQEEKDKGKKKKLHLVELTEPTKTWFEKEEEKLEGLYTIYKGIKTNVVS